ncbi:MAG TPA: hypothetical protein VHC19_11010 [Pirellulales bacterium]|nr:hypothetical protein [Pirellulales bacterium]
MLGRRFRAVGLSWGKFFMYIPAILVGVVWYGQGVARQHQAVDAILAAGGQVTYDLGRAAAGSRKAVAVRRGESHLWLDLYKTPTDAQLVRCSQGDALCTHLAKLSELKFVKLDGSRVSDEGLAQLAKLRKLQALNLDGTDVTDGGMKHLARMTELWQLVLSRTRVTDYGLQCLGAVQKLRWLTLEESLVSDVGVERLRSAIPNCGAIVRTSIAPQLPDARLELLAAEDEPVGRESPEEFAARFAFE